MSKLRSTKLAASLLPAGMISAWLLAGPVSAQTVPGGLAEELGETQTLEKFVVTGSYIPYSADAPAVPISVVRTARLEATGQTSDLLEAIRKSSPQFIGNGNLGSSNANISSGVTNGGSQLQLRNVPTLVLINGRRAAFAPVGATGGYDFVDVNAIPVSAVERVEILKDGASALYGSDAVSGVVNIILKDNYQGAEMGGQYSFSRENGDTWEDRSAHFTVGARSGKTSVTVSGEWVKTDPLFQNSRKFSEDQTGQTSSFAGIVQYLGDGNVYFLAPGAKAPLNTDKTADELVAEGIYTLPAQVSDLFNLSPYQTLTLGNEKQLAVVSLNHKLSENAELFGEFFYSNVKTFLQLAAQPIVGMPYFAQYADGFGGPYGYTLAEHPQNPFDDLVLVRNRFVDRTRGYYSDNNSVHGLVGGRGQINEHVSWEVAANLNRNVQDFSNTNVINRVNLANAIDNGTINLFNREQDPQALANANLFGTAYSKNRSSLNGFDARLTGDVPLSLPAGPIGYAVGGEFRRETLSAQPDSGSFTVLDPNSPIYGSPSLWDGATSADPFSVSRRVASAFLEVRVPLTAPSQHIRGLDTLELSAAVRHDRYSDTDDPTVPKISLRWMPLNDEFAVRASYSESFRAASLYSLFGPTGVGFTDQPIGLRFVDGRVMDDNIDQAFVRVLSNPELKPETSKSYNLGVVYSPRAVKGLSIEATYFRIKENNINGTEAETDILQDVETNGANSEFADRVRIGGFNGAAITAPGQVSEAFDAAGGSFTRVFVTNFSENFVSAFQDGVDLAIGYVRDIPSVGKLDLSLNGMWFRSSDVEGESYVGKTNGNAALNGGTIPRWNGNFQAELTRGNWLFGAGVYYYPAVEDTIAAVGETDVRSDRHVESYTTVDAYFGYSFKGGPGFSRYVDGLSLRVGANNVFNEAPPLAKASWTDSGADTGTYSPLGRVMYISANYKF